MADGPSSTVSARDLENRLSQLREGTPEPSAGIFGPDSISWKINRESALFLAAGRAALLQLAHPWVATAIAEHSRTLDDPIGRFHQTFRVIFTMVFGNTSEATAGAQHLHRRHQAIRGTLAETAGPFQSGTPYEANQVDALRWVYATLVDSALLAYEMVMPALGLAEREQYYAESKKMAALFGIPAESLLGDWDDFQSYFESMLSSDTLTVSTVARSMAHRLQDGAGLKIAPPFWYRALTIQLLPERLRTEFGFTYGDRERRAAGRALRWWRRLYPGLPASLRFVGPYSEAQARLRGRSHSGVIVRLSNRIWIGQASLFHPEEVDRGQAVG